MRRKTGTLLAAVLGSGIVFLDTTVVTVALPEIGRTLPARYVGVLEGQAYVYAGYLLSESALVILAGALLDVYGRRRLFALGIAAFGGASVLCGLAPSLEWLVVFRVLEGAAGAFLVPGSLALITAAFSGEEQGRAFGVWSGASAGITILGPFVGGLLVDTVSWRAIFMLNVPVSLAALWMVGRYADESRDAGASGRLDLPGTALVIAATGGLVFGAVSGQQREWRDPAAWAALGIGAAASAVLPRRMLRARNPLVPPALFRSRNFAVANLASLLIYAALSVTFYYLPLFLQGVLGYTAAAVGLATVPASAFMAVFSARFGVLAARYGARWFVAAGPAVMTLGVLWLARASGGSAPWLRRPGAPPTFVPPAAFLTDFLPGMILFGAGAMLLVAPLTATLMAAVPAGRAGLASAINTAISDVGPQLAGALVFVAITATFYAGLAARLPGLDTSSPAVRQRFAPLNFTPPGVPAGERRAAAAASTGAFRQAMGICAVLLAAGAVVNAIGIRGGAQG
jgi:EmrB/QacA subfamily drug resistance transporter